MTGPKYYQEDKDKLASIAEKIKFVPYDFSGDGRTVNLIKVQKILNNYK